MGENKRYYWLKLKTDFFASKEIKKLRKIAGGDTYTIIYLKMLLMSVKTDGKIYYESIEDTFADELALELDEDADNVLVVLNFLERHKLIERGDEAEYFLPEAATAIGSETQGAERVRKFREKQKALHGNTDVTLLKRSCNTEKEIEKDIELDIDIEKEKEKDNTNVLSKKKDKTDEQFELLWSQYPVGRKQGKTEAKKAFAKAMKNGVNYEDIEAGLLAYRQYIECCGVETKFIKQASTWFNQRCWEDDYSVTISSKTQGAFRAGKKPERELADTVDEVLALLQAEG